MKDLIKMFPDATKEIRKRNRMDFVANNVKFGKSFWSNFSRTIAFCIGLAIVIVVLFFLLGGAKLCGIKTLD